MQPAKYSLSKLSVYLMQHKVKDAFKCTAHALLHMQRCRFLHFWGWFWFFCRYLCRFIIKVNTHRKKTALATNCVFLSAEGSSAGKKALSQAIKLNIELHSSSCLSMPLLLMLPPKQGIKGLECGVGKSQALSLAARDICKSLCQKREREGGNVSYRQQACMECG